MEQSYSKAMKIFWAYFGDLFIFLLIVEGLRVWNPHFAGFLKTVDGRTLRYVLYAVALGQMVVIKWVANLPLKMEQADDESGAARQLFMSSMLTFVLCDLVVLLGFLLYLLFGLRADFYVFLGLSIFYMTVYFPKRNDWNEYLEQYNIHRARNPI